MSKAKAQFGKELAAGIAIALWLAIFSWPYFYYTLLRWAVSLIAIYLGYQAYQGNRFGWVLCMAAIAVLFNPIAPVFLSKGIWTLIDIAAGIFFLAAHHADFLED